MPKQRQIPRLFPQQLADGSTAWHWKPSKTLRAAGFVNVALGTDKRHAITEADRLNDEVTAWKRGTPADARGVVASAPARPLPRIVRVRELIATYKKSDGWTLTPEQGGLKEKSKTNYETRLRQIEYWARDGELAVRDIDAALITDLRSELRKQSAHKCAAVLGVLRLLLNFAKSIGIISHNPADDVTIPSPPARSVMMPSRIRDAIVEAATELGMFDVTLSIELAFWILQRQRDVLDFGRMAWREMGSLDEVEQRHLAEVVDARGRVMGFRLVQNKTGTWVDAPVPPILHATVEAAMRATNHGYVFPHPDRPEEPMPSWMFQRRFRAARDAAATVAIIRGDLEFAQLISLVQYRDLRRTGMSFYKNAGARLAWITELSGHAVIGKKTILDTYMPGDTAAAIACVATGVAHWRRQQKREKQA
jgi:integrase